MPSMTPRQRVLAAMRREQPDRVPRELIFGAFTPTLMEIFREKTGSDDPAEYWDNEVRRVVRERIRTVGAGGGLLLAPTHVLEPDVPWENVVAFFEAIDEQGVHA